MAFAFDSLPSDIEALRALTLDAIAERDAAVAERDKLIEINDRLRRLLRKAQGFEAKSERLAKLPPDQLNLALAASGNSRRALADYRRRWTIETMFGNLKTKGFNLEDTHITDRGKLSTLLTVLAMAVALCVKTGAAAARLKSIPIKNTDEKRSRCSPSTLPPCEKSSPPQRPSQSSPFSSSYYRPEARSSP